MALVQKVQKQSSPNFEVQILPLDGAMVIRPKMFHDHRGNFVETFRKNDFRELGIDCEFVQEHQSLSLKKGTVRGLHFQLPPYGQAKLVRCSRGRVYDVIVDIRTDSPTFGEYAGVELTRDNLEIIYVPIGFAHGFYTLEDNCEVFYQVSEYYAPRHDGGILWNDPNVAINWPDITTTPILSEKDKLLPLLENLKNPFTTANSNVFRLSKE